MPIEPNDFPPPKPSQAPSTTGLPRRRFYDLVARGLQEKDVADRLAGIEAISPPTRDQAERFLDLARRGLPRMHERGAFAHTLRAVKTGSSPSEQMEGDSLRYTAIAALGLAHIETAAQQTTLSGMTASDLAGLCVARAEASFDMGAIALSAWAAAEAGHLHAPVLFRRLATILSSGAPVATVHCAWALTAGLAAGRLGDTREVIALSAGLLMDAQSQSGLFPHMIPAKAGKRWRGHIGCYADQVYPIQALSRLHTAQADDRALSAANLCAARICALQGPDGQWWWHYDTRDGGVVEGYPVYSVHQHAMGPMALFDLREAGGADHSRAIAKGMRWLAAPPEIPGSLVAAEKGVIWRKVARREPRKAVRALSALTTALSPGLHVPALDTLFPPVRVDYECRPYELGWLLYAWLSGVSSLDCPLALD